MRNEASIVLAGVFDAEAKALKEHAAQTREGIQSGLYPAAAHEAAVISEFIADSHERIAAALRARAAQENGHER